MARHYINVVAVCAAHATPAAATMTTGDAMRRVSARSFLRTLLIRRQQRPGHLTAALIALTSDRVDVVVHFHALALIVVDKVA